MYICKTTDPTVVDGAVVSKVSDYASICCIWQIQMCHVSHFGFTNSEILGCLRWMVWFANIIVIILINGTGTVPTMLHIHHIEM
mmetsp:Transcript_10106/g.14924  ORF Transcript_10106/g.14924 Transcript_10106/m.14924 type:complete len:84 (-) Transcript_10106:931-1182(-)